MLVSDVVVLSAGAVLLSIERKPHITTPAQSGKGDDATLTVRQHVDEGWQSRAKMSFDVRQLPVEGVRFSTLR